MALIPFLQSLGATHLFTLNNEGTATAHDLGDSVSPTRITGGAYSFVAAPLCHPFTHCLRTTTSTSSSVDGAIIENRRDINNGAGSGDTSSYNWSDNCRTLMIVSREENIWNPTVIYEQGGGVNNHTIMGGAQTTYQAADAGQPFLIQAGKNLAQSGRVKFLYCVWQSRNHSGNPTNFNRILFYINRRLQGIAILDGTANFPNHSGDVVIGNSAEALKSFAETTFVSQTVEKDAQLLGMFNNVSFDEATCREITDRCVIAEHVIFGTKAQQQAALNVLTGTVFKDVNCAIEIQHAIDEVGDYTLALPNIQFVENEDLGDIAVQYVGPHTLTLINQNGSNAKEVSAPPEKEIQSLLAGLTQIITGGGSVIIVDPLQLTISLPAAGYKVIIYDDDSADAQDLGTELQRADPAATSVIFPYSSSKAGDDIELRVIAPGFKSYVRKITLLGTDFPHTVTLEQETN